MNKRNCKERVADIPWILPVFTHGILVFLLLLSMFWSLLGMFLGAGAFWRKMMFKVPFWSLKESSPEIRPEVDIRRSLSINAYSMLSIDTNLPKDDTSRSLSIDVHPVLSIDTERRN